MTPLFGPTSGQTCFSCGDPLPVFSAGASFFFFLIPHFFFCFGWGASLFAWGAPLFLRGMAPFFCRGGSAFSFFLTGDRAGSAFSLWVGTPFLLRGGRPLAVMLVFVSFCVVIVCAFAFGFVFRFFWFVFGNLC